MKKLLFGVFVLTMLMTIGYSQSITVTAPAAGVTLDQDDLLVIRWRTEGTLTDINVKIRLWNSTETSRIFNIAESVAAADGRFSCRAGLFSSVPDGSYKILIITTDRITTGRSGVFIFGSPGIDPEPEPEPEPEPGRSDCYSLAFTQPRADGNTTWGYGGPREIRWTMRISPPCDPADNVSLELRDEDNTRTITTIAASTANNGRSDWTIPATVPIGSYKIRMITLGDNPQTVLSGPFNVTFARLAVVVATELKVVDLTGRITNKELKVAYGKYHYRWRIKFKIKVAHTPDTIDLRDVFVSWRIVKRGGSERFSASYTIPVLSAGEEHVKSINKECGDNKRRDRRPKLEEGDYFIEVIIDPADRQKDRNLRNNTLRWNFTLKKR